MRGHRVIWLLGLAGCKGEALPPVQESGELIAYAADVEVCPGNVEYTERWLTTLAAQFGVDAQALRYTTYYLLDPGEAQDRCGAPDCFRMHGGRQVIFADNVLARHQLVHAFHRGAWPARRRLLHEALAGLYDDTYLKSLPFDPEWDIDALLEANSGNPEIEAAGAWIAYWTIERHGPEAFAEFWQLDESGSAESFHQLYADHFGESLAAMIVAVDGAAGCSRMVCAENLVDWVDGAWSSESAVACEGDVVGADDRFVRYVGMEIETSGDYRVTVPDADYEEGEVRAEITPCSGCAEAGSFAFVHTPGSEEVRTLEAGLYRVALHGSASSSFSVLVTPE